jgi:hypothetical protein
MFDEINNLIIEIYNLKLFNKLNILELIIFNF